MKSRAVGVSAKTGDASDATLWLVLMVLATGVVLAAAFAKKAERM